jgi:hypothetical protein
VRLLALLEYAALVIGIIAVIAGQYFGLPKGVHLGLATIGAGIALGGLEGLFTRAMPFRASEDAYEAYAGAPAMIIGLMALLVGAALVGSAYLLSDGQWHATVQYLKHRPAPVLIAAGVLLVSIGTLMMLNPQGRRGLAWLLLLYIPRSLIGLSLVVAGLAHIGLGGWERLDPAAFDRFAGALPKGLRGPF